MAAWNWYYLLLAISTYGVKRADSEIFILGLVAGR
jgi:hypothetical protein